MSLNQYTNLNLFGHLGLELYADNNSSGNLNNVSTQDVSFIRFTSNSLVTITGFDPGYSNSNNKLLVVAYTGTNSLTLKHSASGSTNVNQIKCPSNSDISLNQNENVILIYDSDSTYWRVISGVGEKNHALLDNLQGGSGGNFYHSDQPINVANDVQFKSVNIDGNAKIISGTTKPNSGAGVVADIGAVYLRSDGTIWDKVDSSDTAWRCVWIGNLTGEATGFPVKSDGEIDRTSSGISFSNVTRQFSIAPTGGNSTYSIVIKGREYVKSTTESVTIPNTTGEYYIYFNDSGALTYTSTFTLEIIYKFVYVASIYWNATQSKLIHFGDERHGCTMDGHTHARIHQKDGAVFVSGSALSNFNVDGDGTNNNQTQYSIGSGFVRDEDILHTLSSVSQTQSIPVLYRVGSEWYSVQNTNQKFHYLTRAYFNLNTAGSYSLSEVANNNFCLYHVVATNDVNNPYLIVMGIDQYPTKSAAREAAITEISRFSGLPFVEFVFIATIIYETKDSYTNTGKSRIVSTDTGANYVDWRFVTILNPNTAGVNTHNSLGGIQGGLGGNFYHSNQPINTDSNVEFLSLKAAGLTYPTTDGTNGQVIATDGSGNLTFQTVSGGGGGGTVLDTYINSKTATINNNATSNIQTIFSQVISGIYTFWVSSDPRIKGAFYLNENDISNSILESISSLVSSKLDNAGTLNVYISGSNVIIQNKLGSNITLCVRRETTPLINPEPGNVSISVHNNLYDLQGGATNTYYHSNQPINTTDTVTFAGVTVSLVNISSTGSINNITTSNIGAYRFTSASGTTITGFANGSNGKLLYIHNASVSSINIANASASSLEGNRILTGNSKDLTLKPETSIALQYDATTSRWRILGGSGGGGSGTSSSENPETIDLINTDTTIDLSSYPTTSLRLKNPAQITLSNGTDGVWYTLIIVSDGTYSFTSEVRFPLNNAQPVPSSSNRIDVYTLHCINTTDGLKYLATFAYDYSGVTLP